MTYIMLVIASDNRFFPLVKYDRVPKPKRAKASRSNVFAWCISPGAFLSGYCGLRHDEGAWSGNEVIDVGSTKGKPKKERVCVCVT